MSKKDYQAIARILNGISAAWPAMPADKIHERTMVLDDVRDSLADLFAEDNPRFDRERFMEACRTGRCKGMRPVAA